jgi:hypothetical protein
MANTIVKLAWLDTHTHTHTHTHTQTYIAMQDPISPNPTYVNLGI